MLNNDQTGYAKDEFFSEMRQQSIEHVGQLQTAILETNGAVSFFFYPHDESKPGLPMLPKVFHQRTKQVAHDGLFAGLARTQLLAPASAPQRDAAAPRLHLVYSRDDEVGGPGARQPEEALEVCVG